MSQRSRSLDLVLNPGIRYGLGRWWGYWGPYRYYTSGPMSTSVTKTGEEHQSESNLIREALYRTRPITHTKEHWYTGEQVTSAGFYPHYYSAVPAWAHYSSTQYPCYIGDVAAAALYHGQYMATDVEMPSYDLKRKEAIYRAFKNSRPNVETNFSLPNFIYELKDLRKMFNLFDRKFSIKKNIAGGYLNQEFGWKPMLSDIQKLKAAIVRVKQHWDHVRSNQRNIVTLKGTATYSDSVSQAQITQPTVSTNYCKYDWNGAVEQKGIVMFQSRFSYDILDTDTGGRSIAPNKLVAASVMEALGICANPKIVWDALPFSFLLDWFLPVGDALDTFKRDTFVPGHVVHDCDMHETRIRKMKTAGSLYLPTRDSSEKKSEYEIEYENKYYERTPNYTDSMIDKPTFLDRLKFKWPQGTTKLFLGLALGTNIFSD